MICERTLHPTHSMKHFLQNIPTSTLSSFRFSLGHKMVRKVLTNCLPYFDYVVCSLVTFKFLKFLTQYSSKVLFMLASMSIHTMKWSEVKVAQSCSTLCDPMDYRVHGIPQARILEWVVIPFPRRSSQPWDRTQASSIAGKFFTRWATKGSPIHAILNSNSKNPLMYTKVIQ